jgi:uncharacterized membrane protein YkvA (DUF1232 family)
VVPFKAKLLMLGALVYLVSPIDLIPDVLVGPGVLDDAIVVPGMVIFAMKYIIQSTLRPAKQLADGRHTRIR